MSKSVLDILLQTEIPEPETKKIKVKRLSEIAKQDVVVTIKQLSFSKVAEIRNRFASDAEMDAYVVAAAMVEPDLKNGDLQAKYGAPTPVEVVKKLFLPGEVSEIAYKVEKLSGYRTQTTEDIKKKSEVSQK